MGRYAVVAVVLATAALAGCDATRPPGGVPPLVDTASAAVTGTRYTLHKPTTMPTVLHKAGFSNALELPSGWTAGGYGVHRSGNDIVFQATPPKTATQGPSGANPGSPVSLTQQDLWVVDTRTGRAESYPPVSKGWTVAAEAAAGSWVVDREVTELPDRSCTGGSAYDCFSWRLYARPLSGAATTARLLAQSTRPGTQAFVPLLASNGVDIAWEQGDTAKKSTVHLWRPGAAVSTLLAVRPSQGILTFGSGGLYVTESPRAQGTSVHTVTQVRLPTDGVAVPRTTYTGSGPDAVQGGKVAFFPAASDGHGNWTLVQLGTTVGKSQKKTTLTPGVDGPYTVEWIDRDHLVSYAASGYEVFDTATGRSTKLADDATGLTVPRGNSGYLDLAWNPTAAPARSVLAWRTY
jgi:hypothetical protein